MIEDILCIDPLIGRAELDAERLTWANRCLENIETSRIVLFYED